MSRGQSVWKPEDIEEYHSRRKTIKNYLDSRKRGTKGRLSRDILTPQSIVSGLLSGRIINNEKLTAIETWITNEEAEREKAASKEQEAVPTEKVAA